MKIFRKKSSKIFSKFIPCLSTSAKLKNFAEEDMLVEKSGRGGYAHEFPPRLPRWYFSFIGVLLAEVLWQGMSVFGILFWNFSNLSTRKNMHFKNFHFFITFWQKIGIFFLMCILAGYHCTSIISWQYFENDILLILTWVLNQGPWYFKADALSTRPTEHGKVDESSTDKTETFVYSFRLKNEKIFNPRLRCERPRVRFLWEVEKSKIFKVSEK